MITKVKTYKGPGEVEPEDRKLEHAVRDGAPLKKIGLLARGGGREGSLKVP